MYLILSMRLERDRLKHKIGSSAVLSDLTRQPRNCGLNFSKITRSSTIPAKIPSTLLSSEEGIDTTR